VCVALDTKQKKRANLSTAGPHPFTLHCYFRRLQANKKKRNKTRKAETPKGAEKVQKLLCHHCPKGQPQICVSRKPIDQFVMTFDNFLTLIPWKIKLMIK